ncbi:transcriptional regulator [Paenibacillus rhizovicinus]|uniref:GTP cyclohydrolase 1 type 2 homolog n=1 Tax=Paenibacillus rhizovicinus TaxID=2704463 RepID=A0A6C0NYA9_9BACL|nr:Nif3-like dinuclear metal center hexameric protein [Paenibacillus rhizovicinus]QHW30926.1 transcriptional regulator [Paenibacillus rhizovicinus]
MKITIQAMMEELMRPVGQLEHTVDRLLFGDLNTEVTGVVTAFMPTQYVIEQAVALGANLIISHEGPFFSHQDQEGVHADDPVYAAKKRLIRESGIAIFRWHDYIHRYKPDWITQGLVQAFGWEDAVIKHRPEAAVVQLPGSALRDIAVDIKERLGIPYVRIMGDPDQICARAGVLVGYRGGGGSVIPLMEQEALDLVVYGEGPEWESPEYVRDAVRQGRKKALIVIGHAESEVPGMNLLARNLQERYPDLQVHTVSEKPLFRVV